jgi:ferritin-like metal-binding protein YciE
MPDLNERDTKLVQYLNEAYGKERELETALQAHIGMTTKAPYKKRLQQHLRETKSHATQLERRIKKLGGGGSALQTVVAKAMATAKGPLHAVRGTSEQEKMLKNAKTEYFNEHEEIATYLAIEALAEKVGDKETAKLARSIRRDEERMAKFLQGQIKTLTTAVATEEIPSAQRNGTGSRRRSSRSKRSSGSRSASRNGSSQRSTARGSRSGAKSRTKASSRSRSSSSSRSGSRTRAKAGSRS